VTGSASPPADAADAPEVSPARGARALAELTEEVVSCRRCPRLVAWREQVAREKRAAYRDETYWGRPVPGFGDALARIVVVGLAPAAHGGNRTGRMFTGDRSGDWLYGALYRCGLANQPTSVHRGDGLELRGAYITAPVRCAPPANKPTPVERDTCRPFIERELALLPNWRVLVALGAFGFGVAADLVGVRPKPRFGHGAVVDLGAGRSLVGCYHVSQQNTFTGRLTEPMLDEVFRLAIQLSEG
jgi:uracil-DNA glycosylase family 4